jgi:plastocyanin
MKCVIDDHTDAVVVNRISKYCWNHYRIYDSLWKLYKDVFEEYDPLSWGEYLSRILDNTFTSPWKQPILLADSKKQSSIGRVASYELSLFKGNKRKSQVTPKRLMDGPIQTRRKAFVFIDSEVVWGGYREFWPEEIRVKAGTEVTWKNRDNNGLPHCVTFSKLGDQNSEREFASENLSYGQSFKHVFNKKGTFEYHCGLQGPIVVGRVIVT